MGGELPERLTSKCRRATCAALELETFCWKPILFALAFLAPTTLQAAELSSLNGKGHSEARTLATFLKSGRIVDIERAGEVFGIPHLVNKVVWSGTFMAIHPTAFSADYTSFPSTSGISKLGFGWEFTVGGNHLVEINRVFLTFNHESCPPVDQLANALGTIPQTILTPGNDGAPGKKFTTIKAKSLGDQPATLSFYNGDTCKLEIEQYRRW